MYIFKVRIWHSVHIHMHKYNQWNQPPWLGCENPRSRGKSGGTPFGKMRKDGKMVNCSFYQLTNHRARVDFSLLRQCPCVTSLWKAGAIFVSLANGILHNFEIKWNKEQMQWSRKDRDTTSKTSRLGAQVTVQSWCHSRREASYESFLGKIGKGHTNDYQLSIIAHSWNLTEIIFCLRNAWKLFEAPRSKSFNWHRCQASWPLLLWRVLFGSITPYIQDWLT